MPEPTLQDLQRWLSLVVRHRGDADAAARTAAARALIPRGSVLAGEIVKPSRTMQPLARLDVYGRAYLTRLREVLESDFGALRYALGAEAFAQLAADYVYAHPSRHPNLNAFGAHLPRFVAGHGDLPDREFLAELADLQWTVAEAFAAPEFTPLDVEALRGLTHEQWAATVLEPNPSVRLRRYRYPVNGFLQAFFDGREPAVPLPADHHLVAYRKAGTVWRVVLPAAVAAILAALLAGQPLAAALEPAGDHGLDVGPWLPEWSADGLFV